MNAAISRESYGDGTYRDRTRAGWNDSETQPYGDDAPVVPAQRTPEDEIVERVLDETIPVHVGELFLAQHAFKQYLKARAAADAMLDD